jgi:hypothetical protein
VVETLIAVVAALFYLIPMGRAGYLMLARFGRGWDGAGLAIGFGPIGLVIAWVIRDNLFRDREERLARAGAEPSAFDEQWDALSPAKHRFRWANRGE